MADQHPAPAGWQAPPAIASHSDIAGIEARDIAAFMPYARVHAALSATARRWPDRPALGWIADASGDVMAQRWTHLEFVAGVTRAANLLRRLSGGAPARVALLMPPLPSAWFALWGAETAGLACPINPLLSATHIAELVNASGATIVVALGPTEGHDLWQRAQALKAQCPALMHVLAAAGGATTPDEDFDTLCAHERGDALDFAPGEAPDATAALFHTGGTTGLPKLARHTHANQLHAAWGAACMYGTRHDDVMLSGFPLFHVAGSMVFGLSTLLAGGQVLLPPLGGLRDATFMRRYWQHAAREGVTLLAAVPTVMATLMGVERGHANTARVRALLTGGSPLPPELATGFEKKFGIPVRNILGMTECAGVISIEPLAAPRAAGSCGLPLPFTRVRALRDDGSACAPGEAGVLSVRGPNVGPGYTDAARDAGTFSADGVLLTGDVGHVDAQGRVFVTGRAKDVIIRSSHNIDPGIIEDALMHHRAVQSAAAVGEPDAYAGEVPVAYVSLYPGSAATGEEIAAFVRPLIPEPAAVPRRITVLPSLPLTAIGKIYKPALRALATAAALRARLADAGLAQVQVQACEAGAAIALHFTAPAHELDRVRHRLTECMAPYALQWRLEALPS